MTGVSSTHESLKARKESIERSHVTNRIDQMHTHMNQFKEKAESTMNEIQKLELLEAQKL